MELARRSGAPLESDWVEISEPLSEEVCWTRYLSVKLNAELIIIVLGKIW